MKNLDDMNTRLFSKTSGFASLYNSAPCGLLSFDMSGKIHKMNTTLLKWTGLESSEIIDLTFSSLLEKGSQLYFQLFVYPLLRMHQEVREISLQIETEYESFQCLFSAKAEMGSDEDESVMVHAAIFKVIDRKKFEDELRMKKERAELENEEKADTLKKVASDQSHLVRAPLANVLGLVDLLEQTETSERSKELLIMLKEAASQLDRVVTNIVITANK